MEENYKTTIKENGEEKVNKKCGLK